MKIFYSNFLTSELKRYKKVFFKDDGKKLLFRTSGMHVMDLAMTFNRLLGNPEFGKSGIRPLPKID